MNEELKTIFKNFKVNNLIIPVNHLFYKGSSKTFVTWTILSEVPILSANDEDLYSVVEVDIDIFSDSNYLDIVNEVKKIMKKHNWLWVEDSSEMYEDDTELYHKTITFEKERMIKWQE
jgi:hypothetical protein